jgi:hypothetical protein
MIVLWVLKLNQERRLSNLGPTNPTQTVNDDLKRANNTNIISANTNSISNPLYNHNHNNIPVNNDSNYFVRELPVAQQQGSSSSVMPVETVEVSEVI